MKKKTDSTAQRLEPLNAGGSNPLNVGSSEPLNAGGSKPLNSGTPTKSSAEPVYNSQGTRRQISRLGSAPLAG